MKTPKIVNAMSYIDDDIIIAAEGKSARSGSKAWIRWVSLAAAFVLIFGAVIAGVQVNAQSKVESIVALDVNPSMEIEINKNDKVVRVNALNADAEKVLEGMDLKKVDLNVAVNAIIGSMLQNGYLSVEKNSILISVDSKNESKAAALTEAVSAKVGAVLGENQIDASVLSQVYDAGEEIRTIANEHGISIAKATLIKKIVDFGLKASNGEPYTYEILAPMSVNELKLLLDSKHADISGVESSGTAANKSYIGEDNAILKALEHAGLAKDSVFKLEIELDFERGKMVYSIEFKTEKFEFEYEIDVLTGDVVEFEKEANDDRYDDDWDERFDDDDDDDDDDWEDRYKKFKWLWSWD